ncbi:helix-turn-helix transcriptional regulator [Pedobacter sp.]|uniref:helix-turn-helix transcriptional regulator n=1 Tax=Pedobacter sp. TaxID=1411316 RepID=UPI003D7FC38E
MKPITASVPADDIQLMGMTIIFITLLIVGNRLFERRSFRNNFKQEKHPSLSEKPISPDQVKALQTELASLKRELANSALSLIYKNELLQKISIELGQLKDLNGNLLPEERYRKILKMIDDASNDEQDWTLFEKTFNEAHENFFKKIKQQHPHLVPNDLKLCAFLHMNMSSKEIASLLNISLRGVEIRRYRLRKKLQVPHDQNLVAFLLEL